MNLRSSLISRPWLTLTLTAQTQEFNQGPAQGPARILPACPEPLALIALLFLFSPLIKTSACVVILRWVFEDWEKSPICSRCRHSNKPLSSYWPLSYELGFPGGRQQNLIGLHQLKEITYLPISSLGIDLALPFRFGNQATD